MLTTNMNDVVTEKKREFENFYSKLEAMDNITDQMMYAFGGMIDMTPEEKQKYMSSLFMDEINIREKNS